MKTVTRFDFEAIPLGQVMLVTCLKFEACAMTADPPAYLRSPDDTPADEALARWATEIVPAPAHTAVRPDRAHPDGRLDSPIRQ